MRYQICGFSTAHYEFLHQRDIRIAFEGVDERDLPHLFSMLPAADRLACRKLAPRRRSGFIISRIALKTLLREERQQISGEEVLVYHQNNGNPVLNIHISDEEKPRFAHIGISHTGMAALAAVGPRPFGIDVEHIRRGDCQWVEGFLSSVEIEQAIRITNREHVSMGIVSTVWWSAKEAYLKALGVGLRLNPKHINCVFDWQAGKFDIFQDREYAGEGIFSTEGRMYSVALAVLERE